MATACETLDREFTEPKKPLNVQIVIEQNLYARLYRTAVCTLGYYPFQFWSGVYLERETQLGIGSSPYSHFG